MKKKPHDPLPTLKFLTLKKIARKKVTEPLWKGPESTDPNGGVTQSMINGFLFCRERFRVSCVLGLGPPERFEKNLEYGHMWHLCEEHPSAWEDKLKDYAKVLVKQYTDQQEQVAHWYNVCKLQFPFYLRHWKRHTDKCEIVSVEETFKVPYELPSGRTVFLRGKWDEVRTKKSGKRAELWLKENKTKGTLDEEALRQQFSFDLQTMTYLTALDSYGEYGTPVGVLYNVVRRPLSGGKGTIRQKKPTKANPQGETLAEFYARLGEYIADEPDSYFMRWEIRVSQADIATFKEKFLTPILEQMCEWYSVMCGDEDAQTHSQFVHWQTPYGIWNPIARGVSTDLDEYIRTGSTVGLVRKDRLFKELD